MCLDQNIDKYSICVDQYIDQYSKRIDEYIDRLGTALYFQLIVHFVYFFPLFLCNHVCSCCLSIPIYKYCSLYRSSVGTYQFHDYFLLGRYYVLNKSGQELKKYDIPCFFPPHYPMFVFKRCSKFIGRYLGKSFVPTTHQKCGICSLK